MEFASPPQLLSQLRTRQNWAKGGWRVEGPGEAQSRRPCSPSSGPCAGGWDKSPCREGMGGLHRAIRLGRVFRRASSPVPLPTVPQQEEAGVQRLRVRLAGSLAPLLRSTRSLGAMQALTRPEAPTPSVGSFVVLDHGVGGPGPVRLEAVSAVSLAVSSGLILWALVNGVDPA